MQLKLKGLGDTVGAIGHQPTVAQHLQHLDISKDIELPPIAQKALSRNMRWAHGKDIPPLDQVEVLLFAISELCDGLDHVAPNSDDTNHQLQRSTRDAMAFYVGIRDLYEHLAVVRNCCGTPDYPAENMKARRIGQLMDEGAFDEGLSDRTDFLVSILGELAKKIRLKKEEQLDANPDAQHIMETAAKLAERAQERTAALELEFNKKAKGSARG